MPAPDFSAVDLNLGVLGVANVRAKGASEFGRPTGFRDPTAYRGKAASESLPYANRED